ncbi:MAG: response regulator transcription factor, partial [Cyanobacteria bacterium P01_C01_bin.72]
IESVYKNCTHFGSGLFEKIQNDNIVSISEPLSSTIEQLTPKEKEVLNLLTTGAKNKEIAQTLCLAESTVKNYVSRILSRLQLRDRIQAALFANSYLDR